MLTSLRKHLHLHKTADRESYALVAIVVSAFAAMAISLAIGLQQSVWFDEAYSILLAKQSWSQLMYLTSIDTHPPLYYLLLKVWASVFGWSELALRSLSVLSLGGAITVGGLLIKRLFGVKVAVVAVAIMALSPFLLRYGFEIRMYALGSLIGVAATYVLVLAQEAKSRATQVRHYALYAALVALGMYTLYYTALLWIAHVVWLAWVRWRQRRSVGDVVRSPWLLAYVGAVALFLPWLPTFLKQFGNGALAPIGQAMTLDNLLGVASFYTLYEPVWRLGPVLSLVMVFVLSMAGWLVMRTYRAFNGTERSYFLLLALYILVPIAILALIGLMRPMYVERYLSHVAIGASMVLGVAVAVVLPRVKRAARAMTVVFAATFVIGTLQLAMYGNYNFQRNLRPSMEQAASLLSCENNTKIVAGDPYAAIELLYYVDDCPVYFYEPSLVLTGGYAPLNGSELQIHDPAAQLADAQTVHYVYYDQPRVDLSAGRTLTAKSEFAPLSIETLSAAQRD